VPATGLTGETVVSEDRTVTFVAGVCARSPLALLSRPAHTAARHTKADIGDKVTGLRLFTSAHQEVDR
jgi:hypothetical protein